MLRMQKNIYKDKTQLFLFGALIMLFERSLSLKFSRKPLWIQGWINFRIFNHFQFTQQSFFAYTMYLLTNERLAKQNTSHPHFQEHAEKANLYIIWSCISTWIIILQNRFDLGIQHPQMFSHVAYYIIKIGLARVFLIMHKGTNNRFYESICIYMPTVLKKVDMNMFFILCQHIIESKCLCKIL